MLSATTETDLKIVSKTVLWLLITLLFYTFLRLEFLIWNWDTWYHNNSIKDLAEAFLHGLRFDFSSLTWLSSVVLLSALLPWPYVRLNLKESTLKCVFTLIHLPFLFLNMLDLEFIHFSGRRMTINNYYLLKESQGKFLDLFLSYWFIISFNLFLLYIYFKIIHIKPQNTKNSFHTPLTSLTSPPSYHSSSTPSFFDLFALSLDKYFKKWFIRIPFSIFFLIFYIILARGGLQPKPLELAHALSLNPDQKLNHLTVNSSFTTIHSLQQKIIMPLHYFSPTETFSNLLNANTPGELINPWISKPKNVVLIILESFGIEYTGLDHDKQYSFTPFLDSLKSKSIYFNNAFANGRRSIEALPSLLAGLPSLIDEPFLTSPYQSNQIPQIGLELTQMGIRSLFFHGGANGSMFFQEFTQRLGFTQYIGKNEYPSIEKDDDGTWGIWDGPFFSFTAKELSRQKAPFFAVLFSLSSHHPFKVPSEFKDKLPKGPLPIHQSIAYTDQMLSHFFSEASQFNWFNDTLFILTADHTSKSYYEEYQTSTGGFRVPILLYFPGGVFSSEKEKIDTMEPVQHIDIFPTLVDLFSISNINKNKLSRSLLLTGPRNVTLYLNGLQLIVSKNKVLTEPTEGDFLDPQNSLSPVWKAHRQQYINSLLENSER